jgi:nitrite reductase/ring-hydroxylating ferredoxin subunit
MICRSGELVESGTGIRFEVSDGRHRLPAFVIRVQGRARAFLNRCSHLSLELDWTPGYFLDAEGKRIVCATHGATYDPQTGNCLGGPCKGTGLVSVSVVELDGAVGYLNWSINTGSG